MTDEARLLTMIWDRFSDFISTGDKQEAAEALVGAFIEEGTDIETLMDADGECPVLDRVLAAFKAEDDPLHEDIYGYDDEGY